MCTAMGLTSLLLIMFISLHGVFASRFVPEVNTHGALEQAKNANLTPTQSSALQEKFPLQEETANVTPTHNFVAQKGIPTPTFHGNYNETPVEEVHRPKPFPVPCEMRFDLSFTASLFPKNFTFGTATSAFQVEGAANLRGPSIWDVYQSMPGSIEGNSTANIAAAQYFKYPEDVELMKFLGTDSYRFSISWPRILPLGTGPVNPLGIAYYNSLIDTLLSHGIQPAVTLYHWDLPAALNASMGGWLNASIADYFVEYANICFREFGDRVKTWITFNEPGIVASQGYGSGTAPPGLCTGCPNGGNSSTQPYIVAHNILRSHAAAVGLYRHLYQKSQEGRIGISLESFYLYPLTNSLEDKAAAERGMVFRFGWFADPVMFGDYPPLMRELIGSRLPNFTLLERLLLRGSVDFLGLNFYTARYSYAAPPAPPEEASIFTDAQTYERRMAITWL